MIGKNPNLQCVPPRRFPGESVSLGEPGWEAAADQIARPYLFHRLHYRRVEGFLSRLRRQFHLYRYAHARPIVRADDCANRRSVSGFRLRSTFHASPAGAVSAGLARARMVDFLYLGCSSFVGSVMFPVPKSVGLLGGSAPSGKRIARIFPTARELKRAAILRRRGWRTLPPRKRYLCCRRRKRIRAALPFTLRILFQGSRRRPWIPSTVGSPRSLDLYR